MNNSISNIKYFNIWTSVIGSPRDRQLERLRPPLVSGVLSAAAATIRYVALVDHGVKAGEQVVVHGDDGWTRVHFVFKDNGRGPELDERFRLADDGTYANYDVEGTSTFGGPVDEHFARSGSAREMAFAVGTWSSDRSPDRRCTLPMNGTYETASVAIAALARQEDQRVPLLPSGTLSQRMLDQVEVSSGGRTQQVRLFALSGTGFTPELHLDDSG